NVVATLKEMHAAYQKAGRMTKKRVMDGFLEAIEQGKMLADPLAQIAGWREIAKLCNLYAEQKHRVEVNVTGDVTVRQLQQMSDGDLLRLIDGQTIEGEVVVEEVSDAD